MDADQVSITDIVGPVRISPAEAHAIAEVRKTPMENASPHIISSDGSMINAATVDVAMAFEVVDLSQPEQQPVQGRTSDFSSSARAELMGLLAAILSAPLDQDIIVEFDNQAVAQQYRQLVRVRKNTLPRKHLRSNFAGLWAVVHQVVQDRPGANDVVWVRGHKDNQSNNLANAVAKSAAQEATTPWHVDLNAQQEIAHFALAKQDAKALYLQLSGCAQS
ncbi:hypothetical protein BGZ51_000963 [Haplosporangium sp. Z 767]|nr:hypothetical protein BGZ50_001095 [Haplosporangium sp. Z 11]KAF9176317.1 hypothetical protein BGZ51_000963 [Haplosporangium sp. Z 767]